ncbi:GTP-binding protein Di-Ras2-like [Limulus polyphemus]|uniref:GTP-binding protein Di-Ras2-like n=1 Tax=Limulus polyphemus TaxID=6850 RepID=A0ABM1BE26_LIMPO|nr:GTP-binding protein Di-Ras2-like [Limulus polyphemus]
MGESSSYQVRLVVLGGTGVGKSSIIKRFLFNTFTEKHSPTVEDMHYREFDLGTTTLKVDFLDTAGDMQFPAMRRLSIANAQAFLLVYTIDSKTSFETLKKCFEEIREQRTDFQGVPIIVAGNKLDLASERRELVKEDVAEWVFCELPRLRVKLMECSAKDNVNMKELFRSFLILAKIPFQSESSSLHRRSSAHASSGKAKGPEEGYQKSEPRSRSLIRRVSKKVSKMRENVHSDNETNDCIVS